VQFVTADYISSRPSILLPVKELISVCRRYNVMVFVDGAHTPGQIELNLEDLGADFYVGQHAMRSLLSRPFNRFYRLECLLTCSLFAGLSLRTREHLFKFYKSYRFCSSFSLIFVCFCAVE